MAELRNELKFYLHSADALVLENRLAAVLKQDRHTASAHSYLVQSLYFDDPSATAFFEKLDGVDKRSKYRIRFYNNDLSFIRLEKKEKVGAFSKKTGVPITLDEANLFCKKASLDPEDKKGLKQEFCFLIRHDGFRPIAYLSYQRKAFLYPAGNVRITLDSALSASRFTGNFFRPSVAMQPVIDPSETILEVKFDSFLPPFIGDLLEDIPKQISAISKFCKSVEALY